MIINKTQLIIIKAVVIKRGRAKIKKDYVTGDLYKYYKTHTENPVDYATFTAFLFGKNGTDKGLIRLLVDEILYSSYILKLPWGGNFAVLKYKPKIKFKENGDLDIRKSHMRVNWAATRKLWEEDPEAASNKVRVFHINKHTRGYLYDFFWMKKDMGALPNKAFYKFSPCRKIERLLAGVLKEERLEIDFYERN